MDDGSVAGRLRRPTWRDPRLLAGVLLMCAAIVGVAAAVGAADRTEAYYSAHGALVPGTVLAEGDLTVTRAKVEGDAYLPVGGEAPWGHVVTRTVGAGELLPTAALSAGGAFDGRVLGVVASAPLAPNIGAGSAVDLWIAAGDDPVATLVAAGLVVAEVARADGAFSVSGGETVYVTVPRDEVAAVLDAVASGGEVSVVGHGGS
ncbi:hypothetical protein [Demequina sp. NBRC 110053]|uniref:hypothetical protein n=1 Tax=Demequina sp. NBRC 110053 TaxID=1570342 RepID=UPI0009FE4639|nr:hypothetical protein [Demequina sp. NBRC 110053]